MGIVTFNIIKHLEFKKEVAKKKLYMETKIDYKEITELLDSFINENLLEMLIFSPEYTANMNIPAEVADKMPKELSNMVLHRMSDAMKEQLSLIYHTDYLIEVVTRRCITTCIDYIKSYNNTNNGVNDSGMTQLFK